MTDEPSDGTDAAAAVLRALQIRGWSIAAAESWLFELAQATPGGIADR